MLTQTCRSCGHEWRSNNSAEPCPNCHALRVEPKRPICPRCQKEIDPEICWCGDYIKQHSAYCGHNPVPMGCTCGYSKEDRDGPFEPIH